VSALQEMVSVQTFVDFIKNKDVGRIKFAIREAQFDLDSTDEVGRLWSVVDLINKFNCWEKLEL